LTKKSGYSKSIPDYRYSVAGISDEKWFFLVNHFNSMHYGKEYLILLVL
jgi:hypothetical protein